MASVWKNLMKNVKFSKITFLENSFNKDNSVGLTRKIIKDHLRGQVSQEPNYKTSKIEYNGQTM